MWIIWYFLVSWKINLRIFSSILLYYIKWAEIYVLFFKKIYKKKIKTKSIVEKNERVRNWKKNRIL